MSASQAVSSQANTLETQFAEIGVAVVEYVLSADDLAYMDASFPKLSGRTPGARAEAFSSDAVGWFSSHVSLIKLASRLLGREAFMSRLQAFDKLPDANWFVPWHQDRAQNGQDRDVDLLQRMVALRIHLDDCDESNGPLEVLLGTHRQGRLAASAIAALPTKAASRLCLVVRGDIVAMRPLLVHRSQRAQRPASRRVVHLEFTGRDAP